MSSKSLKDAIAGLLSLFIAAVFAAGCVSAQNTGGQKQAHSAAELIALASDPKTQFDVPQVSRFLGSLSAAERLSLEHQLIALQHEELIAGILVDVLKTRDADAADLIASHISGWKTPTQLSALDLPAIARGRFLSIPRALLRNATAASAAEAVGRACILLAKTADPADVKMIRDAAGVQPKSWGVWMALAYAEGMTPSLAAVAQTVYPDGSAPLMVRVAAATALEPSDSKAAAYVVGQVQSYLAQFGSQDALAASRDAFKASGRGRGVPGPAALEYATFNKNFNIMTALLVLKSASAHDLTFQYLNAKNQAIRRFCGIIAARRWPAELLKAGRGLFSENEYVNLAAVITVYRPEERAAAAGAAPPDRLAAAKSKIASSGLGVVLIEARILTFF